MPCTFSNALSNNLIVRKGNEKKVKVNHLKIIKNPYIMCPIRTMTFVEISKLRLKIAYLTK